jgi:hypothetical protein
MSQGGDYKYAWARLKPELRNWKDNLRCELETQVILLGRLRDGVEAGKPIGAILSVDTIKRLKELKKEYYELKTTAEGMQVFYEPSKHELKSSHQKIWMDRLEICGGFFDFITKKLDGWKKAKVRTPALYSCTCPLEKTGLYDKWN